MTPVENGGSQLKGSIRRDAPRTVAALYAAMGRAIGKVTPRDILPYFEHAGYTPRPLRRSCPS